MHFAFAVLAVLVSFVSAISFQQVSAPFYLAGDSFEFQLDGHEAGLSVFFYRRRFLFPDALIAESSVDRFGRGQISIPNNAKQGTYFLEAYSKRRRGWKKVTTSDALAIKSTGAVRSWRRTYRVVSQITASVSPERAVYVALSNFGMQMSDMKKSRYSIRILSANDGSELERGELFPKGTDEKSISLSSDASNVYVEVLYRSKLIYRSQRMISSNDIKQHRQLVRAIDHEMPSTENSPDDDYCQKCKSHLCGNEKCGVLCDACAMVTASMIQPVSSPVVALSSCKNGECICSDGVCKRVKNNAAVRRAPSAYSTAAKSSFNAESRSKKVRNKKRAAKDDLAELRKTLAEIDAAKKKSSKRFRV